MMELEKRLHRHKSFELLLLNLLHSDQESYLDNLFGRAQWMKIGTKTLVSNVVYSSPIGGPGSGVGKGGGGGGSIKEAGGGLGQYGAAREEQFFFNKQREQLEKLKEKLKDTQSEDLTRKEK